MIFFLPSLFTYLRKVNANLVKLKIRDEIPKDVSKKVFAITIILIIGITPLSTQKEVSTEIGTIIYDFIVNSQGDAQIKIEIDIPKKAGATWLYLPNNITWKMSIERGTIINSKEVTTNYVFYNNYSFHFKGPLKVKINYYFTYASLIGHKSAFFMSPLVYFDKKLRGLVRVYLPAYVNILETYPEISSKKIEGKHLILSYTPRATSLRIMIHYTINETQLTKVNGKIEYSNTTIEVSIITHPRYTSIADRIVKTYQKAYPILRKVFHVDLSNITVRFKAPSLEDVSIMGYVPLRAKKLGDIYLNILWIRTKKGFFEQIALHELVHHFLWRAGVNPYTLLWFHEGCADYFSIYLCLYYFNLSGAIYRHEDLMEKAKEYLSNSKKIGFIQYWSVWKKPSNIFLYYALSYYVVLTLGKKYGNFTYYSKVFEVIVSKGEMSTNEELIDALSEAAEEDLTNLFIEWGFRISKIKVHYSTILKKFKMDKIVTSPNYPYASKFIELSKKAFYSGELIQFLYFMVLAAIVAYPGAIVVAALIILAVYFSVKVTESYERSPKKLEKTPGSQDNRAFSQI